MRLKTVIQPIAKVTIAMTSHLEPMGLSTRVLAPAIHNALPDFKSGGMQPHWGVIKSGIGTVIPQNESVDFTRLANAAAAGTSRFMEAFIQAQKEKEERAAYMMEPLVRELSEKKDELSSLSVKEQAELKETLSSIRDEHKERQGQIKKIKKFSDFAQKIVGTELTEVLKSKIDPKTLDLFLKSLKTSSRIATQVVPSLRVLNNFMSAYNLAKSIYPDRFNEIETYIADSVQSYKESFEQRFSYSASPMRSREHPGKESLIESLEKYGQSDLKNNDTEITQKPVDRDEPNSPGFKK